MTHKPDLNGLSPQERQTLVDLMLQYITDRIVDENTGSGMVF